LQPPGGVIQLRAGFYDSESSSTLVVHVVDLFEIVRRFIRRHGDRCRDCGQ
jgi:hypothetical protein